MHHVGLSPQEVLEPRVTRLCQLSHHRQNSLSIYQ
jgi:hypothetical protein